MVPTKYTSVYSNAVVFFVDKILARKSVVFDRIIRYFDVDGQANIIFFTLLVVQQHFPLYVVKLVTT